MGQGGRQGLSKGAAGGVGASRGSAVLLLLLLLLLLWRCRSAITT